MTAAIVNNRMWRSSLHLLFACLSGLAFGGTIAAPLMVGEAQAATARGSDWPEGTRTILVEDLDGLILLRATLHGDAGRDTSGDLVLDTGAPYLALDRHVAFALGIADSLSAAGAIELAPHRLGRLEIGAVQFDQVAPVLSVDAEVVRRVTDRDVLGLLGQRVLAPYILWIDFEGETIALVPAGGERANEPATVASRRRLPGLSPRARAVPFRLAGDGKLLVRARLTEANGRMTSGGMTLALDTGASKTVLFEPALARIAPRSASWPALRGLSAPTLFGDDEARIVRVPRIAVEGVTGGVEVRDMDAAVMRGELAEVLERAVGEPVHGLLGYSFLRRFRVAIDFRRLIVWLDPAEVGRDARPYEYSQIGLQVERTEGAIQIVAVAEATPAAEAGLARGDVIESLDGEDARAMDLLTLLRRLEGPPGSRVTLGVRHGGTRRTLTLSRRQLL